MLEPKLPCASGRSASPSTTIWKDIEESEFRRNVLTLEKLTNAVPLESQVFSPAEWIASHQSIRPENSQLSFTEEQRLADDISYVAAVGEGAQSVAAATVQEAWDAQARSTLIITVASIDAVDDSSQQFLRSIFVVLSTVSLHSRQGSINHLASAIARYHQQRLLNRLRSRRWTKPTYLSRTHKRPLYADFPTLIQRVNLMYGRNERDKRREVEAALSTLATNLEAFEQDYDHGHDAEDRRRLDLVIACYAFCTKTFIAEYYQRLLGITATAQVQSCLKALRQTEKIAAYYRISMTLVELALEHPNLFQNSAIYFLGPYRPSPLQIAFQPWASSAHVHAEISLVIHHDMMVEGYEKRLKPRCIGTSKYLCYLCYLFLKHHGSYFPSATHGACYDQWTVPDLHTYPEFIRKRYRRILWLMNHDVTAAFAHAIRRPEPMTSRENLLEALRESPANTKGK